MSNDTLFFVSLTLLAACGPQFEPADPSLCDGPPPTRTCGPGCRLVQTEPTRPGRALNTTPLDTTRAVSPAGWSVLPAPPPDSPAARLGIGGVTRPLTVTEVLAASGDEVLFSAGPELASLEAASGEVSKFLTAVGLPTRWAAGPSGGFFVVSGRLISPSAPKHGERAFQLPSAMPLTIAGSRAPLPTDVNAGVVVIPLSSGLFSFQPGSRAPLTLLRPGTFTSAALLGGEVYASRCEPMPMNASDAATEGTAVIQVDSRCDIVRGPLGSNTFVTIATVPGVIELMPMGDRLLVRSPHELRSLSRTGAQMLLYALPRTTPVDPNAVIGPLELDRTPSFRSGRCVVSLDERQGTLVREPGDPLTIEVGRVRVAAVPAD